MANSLRHLSREECLVLLARGRLGRVSVNIRALPAILPMNYSLMDGDIVVRTAPGTKLTAALVNGVVGFEVDRVDSDHTHGWSVLVFGHATEIRDRTTLDRVHALPLESWGCGDGDHFINIHTERVTGRAFGSPPDLDQHS
jgi:nitroimidazol reductase NimA-like FMN-containing flavoprotein (pyridoxamine 5'-phosphate oxidase superfamily)